jgi:hypothetical protein
MKRAAALVALLPALLFAAGAEGRGSGGTIGAFAVTSGAVVVLGGDLRTVSGRIPLSGGRSVAATIDGHIVVVTTARSLVVIDGWRRRIVGTIAGLSDARGVALVERGRFAYVADAGLRRLVGIDVERRRVVSRVALHGRPIRLSAGGTSFAALPESAGQSVALLDLSVVSASAVDWLMARRKVLSAAGGSETLFLAYTGRRRLEGRELFDDRPLFAARLRAQPQAIAADWGRAIWAAEGARAELRGAHDGRFLGFATAPGRILQLASVGSWMAVVTRGGIEMITSPSRTARYSVPVPGTVRSVAFVVT